MSGLVASLHATSVGATGYGATRYFSESWLSPGTDIVVTITATGYGGFGQLVETIPDGFTYNETSLDAWGEGRGQEPRIARPVALKRPRAAYMEVRAIALSISVERSSRKTPAAALIG